MQTLDLRTFIMDRFSEISSKEKKKSIVIPVPEAIPVTPKLCHKSEQRNAFITEATRIGSNSYSLEAKVDHIAEGFFFDHEIDHLPGMLSSCIIRQGSLVVCHLFENVGFDKKFVLTDVTTKFTAWAELNSPVTVRCYLTEKKYRDGLAEANFIADLYQNDKKVAEGNARLKIYPKDVYKKLRLRK